MAGKATFSLAAVREALRKHAEDTSLHLAADAVGMSYTGLRGFLAGGKPHPKTREKLVDWYAHHRSERATGRASIAVEDVDAAIAFLKRYIAADGRERLSDYRAREVAKRLFGDSRVD